MKVKNLFILLVISAFVFSCGKTNNSTNETVVENIPSDDSPKEAVSSEVSTSQYASIGSEMADQILSDYIKIKEALTQTDVDMTKKSAENLVTLLADGGSSALQTIIDIANKIADNGDVEGQRAKFEDLSKEVYELVKTSNATTTVYKQFCPMAFDNKGAYWLSTEEQIKNPYFGDKMLKCGSVKETIAANE